MPVRAGRFVSLCFLVATGIAPFVLSQEKDPASVPVTSQNPFDSFMSFSATMTGGIRADQDRKIYRAGNLMRLDFDDSYRVVDLKKRVTWGVDGGHCSQIAAPDAGSYPFSAPYDDFKVERSLTDEKETIDGHICRISHVTFDPGNNSPVVIRMKLWEAQDLEGFPVKIEAEANGKKLNIAYSNVTLKAPDPKLFSHPAKCSFPAQMGQKGTVAVDPAPSKPAPKKAPDHP